MRKLVFLTDSKMNSFQPILVHMKLCKYAFVNYEVDFFIDLGFDIVFPPRFFSTWTFHRPPRYL